VALLTRHCPARGKLAGLEQQVDSLASENTQLQQLRGERDALKEKMLSTEDKLITLSDQLLEKEQQLAEAQQAAKVCM
jgi:hypothetical protein